MTRREKLEDFGAWLFNVTGLQLCLIYVFLWIKRYIKFGMIFIIILRSFTVFGVLSVPITSDNRDSNAVKITYPDLKISF